MEIYKGTGKTTTGTLLLTKSISSLVFGFNLNFEELSTETIRLEIERANGSNFEITKGTMSLVDFILSTTYGEDAITSDIDAGLKMVAVCEFTSGGAVHLFEKDVIKITLGGLDADNTYVINGIEEPETSTEVYQFEHKSMGSDDTNKDFNVSGYDILVLDKSSDIEEINYRFANGNVVKYTMFELAAMSRQIDPVAYVKYDGKVWSSFPSKIQLPLLAVDNINIRKVQGTVINLILRNQL